jgi:hypothetical protein
LVFGCCYNTQQIAQRFRPRIICVEDRMVYLVKLTSIDSKNNDILGDFESTLFSIILKFKIELKSHIYWAILSIEL